MTTAIEIEGITKTYRKWFGSDVKAVHDLSLSVPSGQVFGFLGPNGAGKTTTIKMMCGLINPSDGRVRLNGFDVSRQRRQAMKQIGAVLEGTRNVYWRLSPLENLMYFGRLKGVTGKPLKARAEKLLTELGLWERRHDGVRTFSRGMQQKVAIACALVHDPPIVLLDEPTLGLDVEASRTVKLWIGQLTKEYGKTVLLTTHQLDVAQELCHRVAIINKGQLVVDHSVDDLLKLFRQDTYQIRVQGNLNGHQLALNGATLVHEHGEIVISGSFQGTSQLHELLNSVDMNGLTLLSVEKSEPNLEEVFVELTERKEVTL